ncbi:PREDICTED: uncharacterized protein LOC105565206 [Vollenhovia emeryi]|uniref:uncharacterized protein LOC105565206 n=1 Tax=Vollenhovia emeryi TaxID=411798 RepID=UPI0005F3FEF6|nr:PREDICTED: uncharacterized protein LOC105565206 [Vollenhovia emeryi]
MHRAGRYIYADENYSGVGGGHMLARAPCVSCRGLYSRKAGYWVYENRVHRSQTEHPSNRADPLADARGDATRSRTEGRGPCRQIAADVSPRQRDAAYFLSRRM